MVLRFRLFALLLALGAAAASGASTATPDDAAARLLERGIEVAATEGPEIALPILERALAAFRDAGDGRGETEALRAVGECHRLKGDYERAREVLIESLERAREIGATLAAAKARNNLGLVSWATGSYAEAVSHLQSALAVAGEESTPRIQGAILNNLGLVYDEMGDYPEARARYERALSFYEQVDFPRGVGDTLGNIGKVHMALGRFQEASQYYQRALEVSRELGSTTAISQDLGNLGFCYLGLGRAEDALEAFTQATVLARGAGLAKEEAVFLEGQGSAWLQLGRYDTALSHYRQALSTYEASGLRREFVEGLAALGDLYLKLGDLPSAEASFRQGIETARELGHPFGETLHLTALGDIERSRYQPEKASALYADAARRAALRGNRFLESEARARLALAELDAGRARDARRQGSESLALAREIGARWLEVEALYALGEVDRVEGNPEAALSRYTQAQQLLDRPGGPESAWRVAWSKGRVLEALGREEDALADYLRAAGTIESIRNRLREERFRSGYLEGRHRVYDALIRLLIRLRRPKEAFEYSERLRAGLFADPELNLPPERLTAEERRRLTELRERVRVLQRSVEEERRKPATEVRQAAEAAFSSELSVAERRYQELLDDLMSRAGPAAALAIPGVEEVQRAIGSGTALIEYVVGTEGLTAFVLTADTFHVDVLPALRGAVRSRVELLRGLLERGTGDDWKPPSRWLGETLVTRLARKGWLSGSGRLYLVPHGVLNLLPFAALLVERAGGEELLIEGHVIARLPSAALLVRGRGAASREPSLLALAPQSGRLRWTAKEVDEAADAFPGSSRVLHAAAATEAAFRLHAPRHSVLHLATHGTFNPVNPLLSGLVLEAGGGEDGVLEVHEIRRLGLRADLVTLSACETALGSGYFVDVPEADGFVGLTRSFLLAGSDAVVASLWEVNDRSTLELMNDLYRSWTKESSAAALVAAQRRMAASGETYAHPFHWAGFAYFGVFR